MTKHTRDEEGGLADWAVSALGFNVMCCCGHEEGYHDPSPRGCQVLDCKCSAFRAFPKLEYTSEVGEAGARYLRELTHDVMADIWLPATFRWEELFNRMLKAAIAAHGELSTGEKK